MSENIWSVVYKSEPAWVPERAIFLTRHGSHAYGTNVEGSDIDYRGIFVGRREHYHGFLSRIEEVVQKKPKDDLVMFELRKFLHLASMANPNVLEALFVEEDDILVTTPAYRAIRFRRQMFLTTQVLHTFSGYAMSQLRRLRGHHRWLRDPPKGPPTRAEFGLPERTVIPADQLAAARSAVNEKMKDWSWEGLDDATPAARQRLKDEFERRLLEITLWGRDELADKVWRAAAAHVGVDTNFIELLDRERRYASRLRDWKDFLTWQAERNEQRAALERIHGYDTKHAMHLVRLLRTGIEILSGQPYKVRRPDAEELVAIRRGKWSCEEVVANAEALDARLKEVASTSTLPRAPDRVAIDRLCVEIAEWYLQRSP